MDVVIPVSIRRIFKAKDMFAANSGDENDSDWQTEDEEEIDSDSSQHERDADHMEDITDNNQ